MRIAVIDAPLAALDRIKRIIRMVSGCHIAWATTGFTQAMDLMEKDRPDLLMISLSVDDKSAIKEVGRIKRCYDYPVLIIDSKGEDKTVFKCMASGAVDVVKISKGMSDEQAKEVLAPKLHVIASLLQKTLSIKPLSQESAVDENSILVAIGCSTGGPAALATVLSSLPKNLAASVMVVQHLDEQFSKEFIQWLDSNSNLPVYVAKKGGFPEKGKVLIAGQDKHLILTQSGAFDYNEEPKSTPYRPSVDQFFFSVAKSWKGQCVAVLLTGMGKDGGEGMVRIKARRFHTIAEHESTCVVYGMPKAAIELGAVIEILPIHKIAHAIMGFVGRKNKG
jgi:two-component system, chemotaxis family, response regulator WspF